MTDPKEVVAELHKCATEIARAGRYGWGNKMRTAADMIDALAAENADLRALKARWEAAPCASVDAPSITSPIELRDADPHVLRLNGQRVRIVREDQPHG